MHLLETELEIVPTFEIIPHLYATLGKSVYIHITWLNFAFTIKHFSRDYKADYFSIYSPSITIHKYPTSGYHYSFEICAFGYTFRKGIFKKKGKGVSLVDNTPGFVRSSWFRQFTDNTHDYLTDTLNAFWDTIKKIQDEAEKH